MKNKNVKDEKKEKKGTKNSSQIYLYFFQHSLCHSCSTKF